MNLLQRIRVPIAAGLIGLLSACGSPKGWIKDSSKLNFGNTGGVELGNKDITNYVLYVEDADAVRDVRVRCVNLDTGEIFDKSVGVEDFSKSKTEKGDYITLLNVLPRGFEEGERWKELPPGKYRARAYVTTDKSTGRYVDLTHFQKK